MSSTVRVRFAPSPTGPLHIGGVRTALYNYLYAKKHAGTFILRIEDTDQTRYVSNAEKYIIDALNWCGIPFDEGPEKDEEFGPYRQSERKSIYKQYANQLVDKGHAYYAFDTFEELDSHRKQHESQGKTFIYNWHNRAKLTNSVSLSQQEVKERIESGEEFVIRFKSYDNDQEAMSIFSFTDEIRGTIQIDRKILDDKVLFKSDGMPTYHLANIVDDHLMEISHVIRGEEWLPSLALHFLLYKSFGWTPPKFAHLPLILKPFGKGKLSKRDGDKLGFPVFPLEYTNPKNGDISRGYKEDGYFSDAFINMLALLGWNPGTEQEIFSLKELVNAFDLSRVSKSGAKFSPEKTKWFNQKYMQSKSNDELAVYFKELLFNKGIETDLPYVIKVVSLIKERAVFIKDFWDLGSFFFQAPEYYDEKTVKKQWRETTGELMRELNTVINSADNFNSTTLETEIKEWITYKEIGFGKVMQPLRLSLVGSLKGPHLFDIMNLIGKEETLKRINNSIIQLS